MPNITEAISEAATILARASIDQPRRTAGVILEHVLGVDRAYLFARTEETIPQDKFETYLRLVERRAAGEPLQYVTGHQEFFGLDFKVTPDVLIPRPETEHLVEQVIKLCRERRPDPGSTGDLIVDVGTGSGCIAVSLAVNLPKASLIAIDISKSALAVARENAEAHRVAGRIQFLEGDLLEPLRSRSLEGRVDFIASNPPYVPAGDFDHLQREIREHEPGIALRAGEDGLEFYRRLLDQSLTFLRSGGCLVCEIGFSQLERVHGLIDPSLWELAEVTADLQGIPRTLTIKKGQPVAAADH